VAVGSWSGSCGSKKEARHGLQIEKSSKGVARLSQRAPHLSHLEKSVRVAMGIALGRIVARQQGLGGTQLEHCVATKYNKNLKYIYIFLSFHKGS
jgi:hypothetical protein